MLPFSQAAANGELGPSAWRSVPGDAWQTSCHVSHSIFYLGDLRSSWGVTYGFQPEEAELREQDGAVSFPHRREGVLDDVEPIGNLVLYYITIGEKLYIVREETDGNRH